MNYKPGSLSLSSAVAMGTGVMIGAGIFALTGQVAELAGYLFPFAFVIAAIVSGFSAYTYVKVTAAYPSAGGIAMILQKAYGKSTVTGGCALLMIFSMIINESLVARTFGVYTLQFFEIDDSKKLVPLLAVAIIILAFIVNISGNKFIGTLSKITAVIKIGGILLFSFAALVVSNASFDVVLSGSSTEESTGGFIAAVALAILAYKGFTTITNSGGEIVDPHKNVGRAIIISILICAVVYLLVVLAVGLTLTVPEIISAKNYSLAEASKPVLGTKGVWFTVVLAIVATSSGLIASMFAVSRMLTMLTTMNIIPHKHFGMAGDLQHHTLVYTAVIAALLAMLFDLSRIASLGAIFYLLMDIAVHWGVLRHLVDDIDAKSWVLVSAMILDAVVLTGFLITKLQLDPTIIVIAVIAILCIFGFEKYYLAMRRTTMQEHHH